MFLEILKRTIPNYGKKSSKYERISVCAVSDNYPDSFSAYRYTRVNLYCKTYVYIIYITLKYMYAIV